MNRQGHPYGDLRIVIDDARYTAVSDNRPVMVEMDGEKVPGLLVEWDHRTVTGRKPHDPAFVVIVGNQLVAHSAGWRLTFLRILDENEMNINPPIPSPGKGNYSDYAAQRRSRAKHMAAQADADDAKELFINFDNV